MSGHLVSPAGRDMVCGMEEGVAEITWPGWWEAWLVVPNKRRTFRTNTINEGV